MKTDHNGCSTCPRGQEQYEMFTAYNKKKFVQYDYRLLNGELFSCIAPSLEIARKKRDAWIIKHNF